MLSSLLEVGSISKRFGTFKAVDELKFSVRAGEAVGLMGPNGSGKTTCINVISGLYAPETGQITLGGRDISGLPMHVVAKLGVNRTFQIPRPFYSMSVRENVQVAIDVAGTAATLTAEAVLSKVGLSELQSLPSSNLNTVQLKLLDLARALSTRPKVLLVDELAAGMTPAELREVAKILKAVANDGVGLLVVEHLMHFLALLVDSVVVMNAGGKIFEGKLADAVQDRHVVEVYLGGDL